MWRLPPHTSAASPVLLSGLRRRSVAALVDLPHVGVGRRPPRRRPVRRTVAQLESLLRAPRGRDGRDRTRTGHRLADSLRRRFPGDRRLGHGPSGFDGLEEPITALAAQGLSYGIHVVVAAARWADLRPALKDQIATRIELRLGDPADSEMDRRRARQLADRPPGRGITREGREMAIALAHLGVARNGGDGRAAPPVELLPVRVEHRSVITTSAPRRPDEVLLGLGERDLTPIAIDFAEHPHLLVLGEGECGKTALLRTAVHRDRPEPAARARHSWRSSTSAGRCWVSSSPTTSPVTRSRAPRWFRVWRR